MINSKVYKHDLNRDISNILSVLKFINDEVEINDQEIAGMLREAIKKENDIIKNLELVMEQ